MFPNCPRIAYTRPPNLRELICWTKLKKTRNNRNTRGEQPGFRKCRTRTCDLCPFTGKAAEGNKIVSEIKIKHSGQVVKIKDKLSCNTKNCLYRLSCEHKPRAGAGGARPRNGAGIGGCTAQYVGETSREIRVRWGEHRRSMEDPGTNKSVGKHFQGGTHRGKEDCVMIPFLKIKSTDPFVRKALEVKYINDFDLIDRGLNVKLG